MAFGFLPLPTLKQKCLVEKARQPTHPLLPAGVSITVAYATTLIDAQAAIGQCQ